MAPLIAKQFISEELEDISNSTTTNHSGSAWGQDNGSHTGIELGHNGTEQEQGSEFQVAYWIASSIYIPTLLAYGFYAVKYDILRVCQRRKLALSSSQENIVMHGDGEEEEEEEEEGEKGTEGEEEEGREKIELRPIGNVSASHSLDDSQGNPQNRDTSSSPTSDQQSNPMGANASTKQSKLFKFGMVSLLGLFVCVYVGLEFAYGSWIFTVVVKGFLDFTKSQGTVIQSLFWGAFAFARLFSVIPALLNIKSSLMLTGNLTGSLIASIIMVAFPHNATAIWLASAILGMSYASIYPTAITWMSENVDTTGLAASILVSGATVGSIVIPAAVGGLISKVSPDALFYATFVGVIISASLVALLFLLAFLHKKRQAKPWSEGRQNGALVHGGSDGLEGEKLIGEEESDGEETTHV